MEAPDRLYPPLPHLLLKKCYFNILRFRWWFVRVFRIVFVGNHFTVQVIGIIKSNNIFFGYFFCFPSVSHLLPWWFHSVRWWTFRQLCWVCELEPFDTPVGQLLPSFSQSIAVAELHSTKNIGNLVLDQFCRFGFGTQSVVQPKSTWQNLANKTISK